MNTQFSKIAVIGVSALLTLSISAPSIADDTELLLVDPSTTVATPPNIMFIIDTSGSMGDPVNTTEPYDSTKPPYTGSCDSNRIYWTKLDVVPACVSPGGVTNTQYVAKSSFLCNDANLRMSGIGAYTGVMVQYRADVSGATLWQDLAIGNTTGNVECQSDSGLHGNGTAGDVYAQAGAGLSEFTNNPGSEVSWGAGNAAQVYTAYDGNYLNWKENPVTVSLPKLDIVKAVNRNLMNAISDVNVGVMRFNSDGEGGRILHAISDINTNRATILSTINGLTDGGSTPLAESLYETALYWRGMDADYGDLQGDVDPAAFVGGAPGSYLQPSQPVCTRNFNVLLSDGMPSDDTGAQDATRVPMLPMFGSAPCDGGSGDGACLDDISEYLSKIDISAATPGEQTVITHTIGFDANLAILESTAERSGGTYYQAADVDTLTTAMTRIVENILDKGLAFSAPAVAVNSFNRTQNLNDLYLSTFLPDGKVHWSGNLKKYKIIDGVIKDSKTIPEDAIDSTTGFFSKTARSFWTDPLINDGDAVKLGGAANRLPTPANRRVFTNYGVSNNLTLGSNAVLSSNTSLTLADFGLTGASGEPTLSDVIDWARGADVLDDDNNPLTTQRNAMGDPLHSQPAAVVYGSDPTSPEVVVFTATNDGYFHAVNGDTGVELWSFIPKQLLQDLPELMLNGNSTYKHYGLDGDIVPVVADFNGNGIIDGSGATADFVYVIFGMRRGGNDYFALDVTDRNTPKLLWKKTFPEFGESWSRPVVARVDMNASFSPSNTLKAVVVLGGGYDTVHDTAALPAGPDNVGAGIFMLDLKTGDPIWRAGRTGTNLNIAAMTRSFPSQIRVIDFSGDGFVDRMYAVDVGGQLFRFDVFRNELPADSVTGGVIARFGGEGVAAPGTLSTRRFYSSPDVSIFSDPVLNRRFLAIGMGSGYRAHPLDTSATDVYYSLRDPDLFAKLDTTAYGAYNVALDGDMQEVSGQLNTVIGPTDRGWKFTLPTGQAVLSGSATFDNSVFFVGFAPDVASSTTCQVKPGDNFLYRVNVANGDPVVDNFASLTPLTSDDARVTPLNQGGIAPTPSFLFPSGPIGCNGAQCSPPPIACVGVECFDPGFVNNPVRTLWTQDGIE